MPFPHSNGILAGALAACFGLLVGCSSSNDNTTPTGNTGDGGGATAATFTEVYTTIIGTTCKDHHSGGTNASGLLDMSTQSLAYQDLVGVKAGGPACGGSGDTRVVAGSHATSLLYLKVAGTPPCGNQMPENETPLTADKVALIQSWIDNGAQNN